MIKRDLYLDNIKPFMSKDLVKVITGMRRSGKSTLLEQIKAELFSQGISKDSIISMNFESIQFDSLLDSHTSFYQEVMRLAGGKEGKLYLFFDEIQMVNSWERAVNSFRVDLDCDIYITGSNASLLAGELASLLAGRFITFEVLPFSFKEMVLAMPALTQDEVFDIYRTIGGLPFLTQVNFSRQESLAYLQDIFNSIVLKDIVQRNSFRDTDQLEKVLAYFISEIGTTISVKNLSNVFAEEKRPVSREGIYNYLNAAEDAMLLSRLKRYDVKGKDILRGQEKVYVTDLGLRESLFHNNEARIDMVLENIVFNELKRRGFEASIGKNGTKEIDFVAKKGSELQYFQVAYLLASEETIEREFSAFAGIDDNYPKTVISMDTVDFSRNGIQHMNIQDFLSS